MCRRVPQEFVEFLTLPLSDRGAAWQALVFVAFVALLLATGKNSEVIVMLGDWLLWIQVFGIAFFAWAVWGVIRAPFAVVSKDKTLGKWTRNHFLYHHPQLIFSDIVAAGGGATQPFELVIDDVEPNAVAFFTYEIDGSNKKFPNAVVAVFIGGPVKAGYEIAIPEHANQVWLGVRPDSRFGQRLNRKRKLTMYLRISPEQSAKTVRLFCHSFFIGKDSDFESRQSQEISG